MRKINKIKSTSRACVLTGIEQMEMREFPVPEIGEEDGLLEVEMVGVCGSDPGMYTGKIKVPFPLIQGHEIVGRIVKIGEKKAKTSGVKVGDRVVVENRFGCGVCKYCIEGKYEKCIDKLGYGVYYSCDNPPHLWGAYSEYLYLPKRAMLHKIDESVPLEAAVLTTSVVGNMVKWAYEVGKVGLGDTVVICGPGQQGICCAAVAKSCGAAKIIMLGTGRDKERMELSREFGVTHTCNVEEHDPVEFVKEVTNGELADIYMDASGYAGALTNAPDMLHVFGKIVTPGIYGNHPSDFLFDKIVYKELSIHGVHAQSYHANEIAVKLVESRQFPFEKMITHKFPLEQAELAVRTAGRMIPGENPIKVVICPNGEE